MPNWVFNHLSLTGPKADLAKAQSIVVNADGMCNTLLPYPQHFRDMDLAARAVWEAARAEGKTPDVIPVDGFNSGGYEWCCANWGTKWDVRDATQKASSRNRASFIFDTAWSPPVPIIEALSSKFPRLMVTLRYYEGGMGFKGVVKFKDGQLLEEQESDYRGQLGG